MKRAEIIISLNSVRVLMSPYVDDYHGKQYQYLYHPDVTFYVTNDLKRKSTPALKYAISQAVMVFLQENGLSVRSLRYIGKVSNSRKFKALKMVDMFSEEK